MLLPKGSAGEAVSGTGSCWAVSAWHLGRHYAPHRHCSEFFSWFFQPPAETRNMVWYLLRERGLGLQSVPAWSRVGQQVPQEQGRQGLHLHGGERACTPEAVSSVSPGSSSLHCRLLQDAQGGQSCSARKFSCLGLLFVSALEGDSVSTFQFLPVPEGQLCHAWLCGLSRYFTS